MSFVNCVTCDTGSYNISLSPSLPLSLSLSLSLPLSPSLSSQSSVTILPIQPSTPQPGSPPLNHPVALSGCLHLACRISLWHMPEKAACVSAWLQGRPPTNVAEQTIPHSQIPTRVQKQGSLANENTVNSHSRSISEQGCMQDARGNALRISFQRTQSKTEIQMCPFVHHRVRVQGSAHS